MWSWTGREEEMRKVGKDGERKVKEKAIHER